MEYAEYPHGPALEILYKHGGVLVVLPIPGSVKEWMKVTQEDETIESVKIRAATNEEFTNDFKIKQNFAEALQSFDEPIDPILLNLDYTK